MLRKITRKPLTYANDQALRLMNKTCGELLGRDVEEGFAGVRDIIFEEDWQQMTRQNQPIKREAYYAPWKIWLEIHAYPSPRGRGRCVRHRAPAGRSARH